MEQKERTGMSKGLLQALGGLKQGEKVSRSLLAAMGEPAREVSESVEEQLKLPDLVASEVQEDTSRKEKELFIKLKQPASKPRQYF